MGNVYEAMTFDDSTLTGKTLSDMTIVYCKTINGNTVSQSGMVLTELGAGDYVLMNPNVTERTICRGYLTANPSKRFVVMFDPVDGDIAKASILGTPTGSSVSGDISDVKTDTSQILSRVSNMGVTERVQSTIPTTIIKSNTDAWMKIDFFITDTNGAQFDPADITDPGGPQVYNGVGVEFTDESDSNIVLYKSDLITPLDTVALCHHTAQSAKPQKLQRISTGIYRLWLNKKDMPLGNLEMKFAYFDIAQADATYGASYIQDTTPTSHIKIPYSILVQEEEVLDQLILDVADIKLKTDNLPASPAASTDITDALDSVISDSIPNDGVRPSIRQALLMICRFLMERSISGTTMVVTKEDGSTASMTFTLNDAATPTALTRTS